MCTEFLILVQNVFPQEQRDREAAFKEQQELFHLQRIAKGEEETDQRGFVEAQYSIQLEKLKVDEMMQRNEAEARTKARLQKEWEEEQARLIRCVRPMRPSDSLTGVSHAQTRRCSTLRTDGCQQLVRFVSPVWPARRLPKHISCAKSAHLVSTRRLVSAVAIVRSGKSRMWLSLVSEPRIAQRASTEHIVTTMVLLME